VWRQSRERATRPPYPHAEVFDARIDARNVADVAAAAQLATTAKFTFVSCDAAFGNFGSGAVGLMVKV
jgi:hypothetical protein